MGSSKKSQSPPPALPARQLSSDCRVTVVWSPPGGRHNLLLQVRQHWHCTLNTAHSSARYTAHSNAHSTAHYSAHYTAHSTAHYSAHYTAHSTPHSTAHSVHYSAHSLAHSSVHSTPHFTPHSTAHSLHTSHCNPEQPSSNCINQD